MSRTLIAAICLLGGFLQGTSAFGQNDTDFYRGRNVTLIVGYGPGGGYDVYARFVARHMTRYLAGNPVVVVQNMPGAGSLASVNYLYNNAPRDGSTFGTFAREMPMMSILGYNAASVKFDARKLTWLGTASSSESDPTLLFIRREKLDSVVQAVGAAGKELLIGATAAGSGGNEWANFMRVVLGLNLKIIPGYRDSSDIFLAVDRGEVDGRSLDYSAVRTGRPQWLESSSPVRVVLQLGRSVRHPDFPDAPTGSELATTERDKALVEIANLSNTLARPFAAPPDIPAQRREQLQKAFMRSLSDETALEEGKRLGIEISPVDGSEVLRRIEQLASTPPELLAAFTKMRSRSEATR